MGMQLLEQNVEDVLRKVKIYLSKKGEKEVVSFSTAINFVIDNLPKKLLDEILEDSK